MSLGVVVLGLLLIVPCSGGLVAQSPRPARQVLPVLDFPEPGLDDTASYQGYQTRFYRDSKQNTVQVYLEPKGGRVVTLWADAANESAGFTVRDGAGGAARLTWGAPAAAVSDSVAARSIEFWLQADASHLELGGFLLGSMRVERDYQYAKRHLRPLSLPPYRVAEESLLVAAVHRLPAPERTPHLALLGASDIEMLRSRLGPAVTSRCSDVHCSVLVERRSLDGRNRLVLELGVDPRRTKVQVRGENVTIRTRPGSPIAFAVKVTTDAAPLTPLRRNEIFNPAFLTFLAEAAAATDSAGRIRHRRMERQVRGVELLSSKEKLMAGLPNFATYFGRDMMMTALMMRPVWSPGMVEHVIASVLRKLGPNGDVSHEEALGGQAIRENAVLYDSLVRVGRLEEAREVLANLQRTRENYHMIDDEFQLPVLVAGYLADPAVPAAQKLGFLFDSSDGRGSRLSLLLREMALVTTWTRPYVDDPRPARLVSFPKRDATHWRAASWRDSDAGYAGGRFAMDVNAIWAPHALRSVALILSGLSALSLDGERLSAVAPGIDSTPLGEYRRDPAALDRAVEIWRGARRHFEVTLPPAELRRQVNARLAQLPTPERRYWQKIAADRAGSTDSLFFLALSLDADGKPIPVVNTDIATEMFLENFAASGNSGDKGTAERDASTLVLPYPVGLLIDSLGPVVANDAYASPRIWERFSKDTYHSPRVVWGREVNLISLGLAKMPGRALQSWLQRILTAVDASGLGHNELWSYRIEKDRLRPTRYGTSSDVQLWNTTDLAVEFVLSRLGIPPR